MNDYTFGKDFNYNLWTADTEITLCNVPWNPDYRDVVRFNTPSGIDDYIDSMPNNSKIRLTKLTYLRPNEPVKIATPFNTASRYNYLRVTNPIQPVTGDREKVYYYFITAVNYISPQNTELVLQLDVWQTYNFDVQFGKCYLERGHMGIANENQNDDWGRKFLTVPEGLDLGNDYVVTRTDQISLGQVRTSNVDATDFGVAVVSAYDMSIPDFGTVDAPVLATARGGLADGMPSGANIYLYQNKHSFLNDMAFLSNKPWVSKSIIAIFLIPNPTTFFPNIDWDDKVNPQMNAVNYPTVPSKTKVDTFMGTGVNFRQQIILPGEYLHLRKLRTFPYSFIEVSNYTGNSLIIKPENVPADTLRFATQMVVNGAPIVKTYPIGYGAGYLVPDAANSDIYGLFKDDGEFYNNSLTITNMATVATVSDSYLSFLASNRNQLAFSNQSADWSQQKALLGNQLSYDQASMGINTSQSLNDISVNQMTRSTEIANQGAMISGGMSVVGSAMSRDVGGVAMSAANTALNIHQANQNLSNNVSASRQSNAVANRQAAYNRDTNRDYADFVTRGDYSNELAAINARVQDAKLSQPAVHGNAGGDSYTLARYVMGFDVKIKTINSGTMRIIGDYWLRYGYAVNRFVNMPSNYRCMQKFTYWKVKETSVSSSTCPQVFRDTIRGIFEKGVTVYGNPSDIHNLPLYDNQPLSGIVIN